MTKEQETEMADDAEESSIHEHADKKSRIEADPADSDMHPINTQTPHTSELDALLQHGWRRLECGGQGECGYLTIAQGRALHQQGSIMSCEVAERAAVTLRAGTFQHMQKPTHVERFQAAFAHDPEDPCSGESDTWENYITKSSRKGAWIDGLQLQSLAEKFGQVIVVWSMDVQKSGHGVWQRYIYSPRFSDNGEACEARNTPPIALTLEAGHYKLLVPPDDHMTIPGRWLRWTQQPARTALRGAGHSPTESGSPCQLKTSYVPDTPSVHTVLATPKRAEQHGGGRADILSTPTVHSIIPGTPSVHTIRPNNGASVYVFENHSVAKTKSQQFVSLATATSQSSVRIPHRPRHRLNGKQKPDGTGYDTHDMGSAKLKDKAVLASHGDEHVWVCNQCHVEISATSRHLLGQRRSDHIRKQHKGIATANFRRLRESLQVIQASNLPADQRTWTCFQCNLGLPAIQGKQRWKSIKEHIQKCCAQETTWSHWLKKKATQEPHIQSKFVVGQKAKKAKHDKAVQASLELAKQAGHDIVCVDLANADQSWSRYLFTCRTCCVRDTLNYAQTTHVCSTR